MGSAGIEGVIMQARSVNRDYSTIRSALPLRGNPLESFPYECDSSRFFHLGNVLSSAKLADHKNLPVRAEARGGWLEQYAWRVGAVVRYEQS